MFKPELGQGWGEDGFHLGKHGVLSPRDRVRLAGLGWVLRWVCGREGSPQKGLWGGLGQEPQGWVP